MIGLEEVKRNPFVQEFIRQTEIALKTLEYTEHGFRHAELVAKRARKIAKRIGLSKRDQELAAIAGYCHDMGNFLGRTQHHYWGALLFNQVFKDDFTPEELTLVMQAIANHDKEEMKFSNPISPVVVLADKSDVHRSRVFTRAISKIKEDIHDRVNYATTRSIINVNRKKKTITLNLKIDTKFVPIMEYFEIFTGRMVYCRKAARYLGYKFGLIINNFKLL